ncbi:MAG: hypothetical protein HC886_19375 [Leptolyngbyaceae cyanobacterium SM1_1_3]|nr:hypothetical protein [Leptolyngbyaceae cyanobacterium SM1_1_3]NJN01241.1 hypothetical protein [Leptolyngbyaceae cyanobacterium RM1_1_2]NJO11674.1 hypothetical protein [Leptolyngbyaceae cyanobacterium SL_1_1]
MNLCVLAAAESAGGLPLTFTLVYVVGFVAAVSIGSVAWYNSKRPAGWEGKDRPDFVPEVKETAEDESN